MMQTIAEDKSIRNQSNEGDGHPPEISIFLPVFNEEPNLRPLHEKLNQSLAQLGRLLDPTNSRKSMDQLVRLLTALGRRVQLSVEAPEAASAR